MFILYILPLREKKQIYYKNISDHVRVKKKAQCKTLAFYQEELPVSCQKQLWDSGYCCFESKYVLLVSLFTILA